MLTLTQYIGILFARVGFLLCYGCSDGSFEFIDPNRLTPMMPTPFKWGDKASSIRHITFSKSSNYIVYTVIFIAMYRKLLENEKKYCGNCLRNDK